MRQLAPLTLTAPGSLGLNTEDSLTPLGPLYALEALNAVIDGRGRLASREGTTLRTTGTIASAAIKQIFEFRKANGNAETVVSWDGGIANSITNPGGSDISGSVTDSDGNWQFLNFNDYCLGFNSAVSGLIEYTGSGDFTAPAIQTDGETLQSGIATAAFGRIWAVADDYTTVVYSALLDHLDYREASGGGILDMSSIWTQGTDRVRGIASFNGALIVFGERHIIFWIDGQGSALGLDPIVMYVSDVVEGTGLVARDSIQPIGETDMLYLSPSGVQSISRLIAERSAPVKTITDHNRTALLAAVDSTIEPYTKIRSAYDPENGAYILALPATTDARVYVLDVSRLFQDEQGRTLARMTRWALNPTAMAYTDASGLLFSSATDGAVAAYDGSDDEGSDFDFTFTSPWSDMGEQIGARLKILKQIASLVNVSSDTTMRVSWAFDFGSTEGSKELSFSTSAVSEWGVAEWGEGEWGAAFVSRLLRFSASGTGQFIQITVRKTVGTGFALQQIRLFAKIGRLA